MAERLNSDYDAPLHEDSLGHVAPAPNPMLATLRLMSSAGAHEADANARRAAEEAARQAAEQQQAQDGNNKG